MIQGRCQKMTSLVGGGGGVRITELRVEGGLTPPPSPFWCIFTRIIQEFIMQPCLEGEGIEGGGNMEERRGEGIEGGWLGGIERGGGMTKMRKRD